MDGTVAKPTSDSSNFDTRPLWHRTSNKFKHIRGIPIEESVKLPSTPKKKVAASPDTVSDNLLKAIEAVATGTSVVDSKEGPVKNNNEADAEIIEITDDDDDEADNQSSGRRISSMQTLMKKNTDDKTGMYVFQPNPILGRTSWPMPDQFGLSISYQ